MLSSSFGLVQFELLARKGSWPSLYCIVPQYMLWRKLFVLQYQIQTRRNRHGFVGYSKRVLKLHVETAK